MSYFDVPPGDETLEIGRTIYMQALAHRRGFRYDQLGIDDEEIWKEILQNIGEVARTICRDNPTPAPKLGGGDE